MKPIRTLFIVSLFAAALPAQAASNDDQDWTAFGHMLTLVQTFVRIGMQPNPDQAMADLLAGRNLEANQAIASLFAGATAEMPEEYRARVATIGRDIAGYALQNPVSSTAATISTERTLQARKDLTAMGLRYYDHGEFLDAVKRNDELAAQLYIAAKGVDLTERAWSGRTALDIARDNGNTKLAELIARNLPAKH
jgi:ankyrin repeat protein